MTKPDVDALSNRPAGHNFDFVINQPRPHPKPADAAETPPPPPPTPAPKPPRPRACSPPQSGRSDAVTRDYVRVLRNLAHKYRLSLVHMHQRPPRQLAQPPHQPLISPPGHDRYVDPVPVRPLRPALLRHAEILLPELARVHLGPPIYIHRQHPPPDQIPPIPERVVDPALQPLAQHEVRGPLRRHPLHNAHAPFPARPDSCPVPIGRHV